MNNKNFIICRRPYTIDVGVCDLATSLLVARADRSENDEFRVRVIQAIVLRAVGLEALISIPAGDIGEVTAEIMKILLKGNGDGDETND